MSADHPYSVARLLSLAGIRYRSVLETEGGPIASLEEGVLQIGDHPFAQANARLKIGLGPSLKTELYSNADGTGMHRSAAVARHIAVSEALERWAYHSTVTGEASNRFGFDLDPSSNGMAAFPGLTKGAARIVARQEAIERYCLLNWWEGHLCPKCWSTESGEVDVFEFEPVFGQVAVLLHSRSPGGYHAYGHAAGSSLHQAINKATLEMKRHEWTIGSWNKKYQRPPTDVFELRSWYFSTTDGYELFKKRRQPVGTNCPTHPRVVCDAELPGPWSQYATVWRFAFDPPSLAFISDLRDFFYW